MISYTDQKIIDKHLDSVAYILAKHIIQISNTVARNVRQEVSLSDCRHILKCKIRDCIAELTNTAEKDLPIDRAHDDNDMLALLCVQIEANDSWDSILNGLNERGQNDLIDFVTSKLYKNPGE